MTEYKTQAGGHSTTVATWQDLSGNGNSGTLQGGTWKENALLLDGIDDGVKINRQDLATYTLEITVKLNSLEDREESLIGNWETGGGGIYVYNGKIMSNVYNATSSKYEGVKTDKSPNINKIYKIVTTYEDKKLKLYIDGVLEKESLISGEIGLPKYETILAVGANPKADSLKATYFDGNVYSVKVYDRALTQEEIQRHSDIDSRRFTLRNDYVRRNLKIQYDGIQNTSRRT